MVVSTHLAWRFPRIATLRRTLYQLLTDHQAQGVLAVALVDDVTIQRLHAEFLGQDSPTDVMSFPLQSPPGFEHDPVLGQIVVSVETAKREARKRGLAVEREVALYALHGALHLVGFDDLEPAKKRVMRRAEQRYLAFFDALVGEVSERCRSSRRRGARRPGKKQRPARA